jgi:two-component system, cell cycle sensor histidine kinase and response regulator CckA
MPARRTHASPLLAVVVLLLVGYQLLPSSLLSDLAWVAAYTVGALGVAAGVRRNRPAHPSVWWAIAAGLAVLAVATGLYAWSYHSTGADPAFPTAAEWAICGGYALLIAALGRASAVRGSERPGGTGLLDVAITAGGVLLVLVTLLDLRDVASTGGGVGVLVALRGGLMCGLLMTLAGIVCVEPRVPHALRLVGLAGAALVLADLAYLELTLTGSYGTGALVDSLWLAVPLLLAVAAWHPGMRELTAHRPRPVVRSRQIALLAVAVLLAPAVLLLQLLRGADVALVPWTIGSVALGFLVLLRLTALITAEERVAARAARLLAELTEADEQLRRSDAEARRIAAEAAADLARYDLALLAGGMAVWTWDRRTDVLRRSAHAAALFDLPAHNDGAGCTDFLDRVHPEDRERTRSAIADATAQGMGFDIIYRIADREGRVRHVRDVGRPDAADGNLLHGVMLDVTERAVAIAALREREALSRAVLDTLQAETAVLGADGRIRAVNAAWAAGTCSEESERWEVGEDYLARWSVRTGMDEADRDGIADGVRAVLEGRAEELTTTYRVGALWFDLRVQPLPDVGGVVVSHFDVTLHKAVEAQLRQAQRMEAVGQLAGGVAHDFNNLLTAISGYCELVGDQLHRGDAVGALGDVGEIARAAERAATLVEQLLSFSRRQPARLAHVDVDAVIDGLLPMLGRLIGEHIAVTTDLRAAAAVEADPSQLEQVVVNLAVNARDAMPGGGRLDLATEVVDLGARVALDLGLEPGRYVEITVTDTGVGMEPDVLAAAFEPYYTTKPEGSGTGLGLATVYGCVTRAGGSVRLTSRPGAGTRVHVLLPASAAPAEAHERTADRLADAVVEQRPVGESVLLVEDQQQVRQLLVRSLARLGYRVTAAGDGAEALALAELAGAPFDLVLTDVLMPNLNGPDLVTALGERDLLRRVVYMSGYTSDVTLTGEGAAPTFLQKPFSLEELTATVRGVLAQPEAPRRHEPRAASVSPGASAPAGSGPAGSRPADSAPLPSTEPFAVPGRIDARGR